MNISSVAVPLLRTREHSKLPTMGTVGSAGSDLYACLKENDNEELVIPSKSRAIVPLGISVAIPEGYYGRIAPRSSLAAKHGLDVGAGVVDSDYRGNVGVVLFNHGDQDYTVKHGDRVAQLIITPYAVPEFVEIYQGLEETKRGDGGFGSTGV